MKDKLQEIYDGLKERLKSPFLLTFIVVWVIHNWEFVYALFTFNSEMPYINRVLFLKLYLKNHDTNQLLWFPILWAFLSIILYFVASFLSEGLNLLYNKWIRTWLYLIIDRNKLKTEDDYNALEERRKNLQELVNDLRRKEEDASLKLKSTEKSLNEQIAGLYSQVVEVRKEKGELDEMLKQKNIEIEAEREIRIDMNNKAEKNLLAIDILKGQNQQLQAYKDWVLLSQPDSFDNWEKLEELRKRGITQGSQKDREKFKELFSGKWRNKFDDPQGIKGVEIFTLRDSNGELSFVTDKNDVLLISNIQFLGQSTLLFTKTNIKIPTRQLHNSLTIVNELTITGMENGKINIVYTKIE
jgi:hypothetical protein